VGQFDAPFTMENRTSDAYTDFIERSMVSRSLGVPRNKEVGAMLHGLVGRVFYYSAGVFNGEGPGFRNVDNQPDAIGRFVVAPLAPFGFPGISIGASGWYGKHVLGPAFPLQATPGGVTFFTPRWLTGQSPVTTMELRENGTLSAVAGELNLPVSHRFGLRAEGVLKREDLSEADVSFVASGGAPMPIGHAFLNGQAAYGELWLWLVGDDRQLPVPGMQLPAPFDAPRIGEHPPLDDGLMLALRGEVIKEDLTTDRPDLGDPNRATTRVISGTAGLNYWRGRLVRVSVNYVLNVWSGTSENIRVLRASGTLEHEVMARFALSL
jgi:hypothetical protein